jgi:hypothetical protein
MMDREAHRHEELEPSFGIEPVEIAVFGDRRPANELHRKVWESLGRRACIKDLADPRVVHQCQRLTLCFEAAKDCCRIHARLEHLERDEPADRRGLLCKVHDAEPTFTKLLDQSVRTDRRPDVVRPLHGRHRVRIALWIGVRSASPGLACTGVVRGRVLIGRSGHD